MEQLQNLVGNRKTLLFLVLFLGFYGGLHTLYFMIPDSVLRETIYHFGLVEVCVGIINMAASGEYVIAHSNLLQSAKTTLEIVRGCDGIGTIMLIVSAIAAFSTNLKNKLVGLVLGVVFLYCMNLIRIIVLYFVSAYHSDWFTAVHTYFAPSMIVITGCLFFLAWAERSIGE